MKFLQKKAKKKVQSCMLDGIEVVAKKYIHFCGEERF